MQWTEPYVEVLDATCLISRLLTSLLSNLGHSPVASMARINGSLYAVCKAKLGALELIGTSELLFYHGLELLVLAM